MLENKINGLLYSLLGLYFAFSPGLLFAQTAPYAEIAFEKAVHDFGTIKESGYARCEFEFSNTGNAPLEIRRVTASCGCTTPDYPKAPIAPGAKATIKVAYNTTGRPGPFNKNITVYSNATANPAIMLSIRGIVESRNNNNDIERLFPKTMGGLRLKRTMVPMGDVLIGSIKTETIPVYNQNEAPIDLSFYKVPAHMRVVISNSRLEHGNTGIITINYIPEEAKDYGHRQDYFYIVTDSKDKENPANKIIINANIKEDFSHTGPLEKVPRASFSQTGIDLGKMSSTDKKTGELILKNLGEKPLMLRKASASCDCINLKADRKEIAPGKETRIRIVFAAGKLIGNLRYTLEFITNDPRQPITKIPLTVNVISE